MNKKTITITVDVEEWFHSNWFDADHIINKYYHDKIPKSDVVESIKKLNQLFNKHNVQATFFVLGETAIRYPEIIDLIKDNGHELSSHGFHHDWDSNDLNEFKDQIQRFKSQVFAHPLGFRFPNYDFSDSIIGVLEDEGFLYDSSVVPSFNLPGWYGDIDAPTKPYEISKSNTKNGSLIEFPISVYPLIRLPGSGGWFFRNMGLFWTTMLLVSQSQVNTYANFYIHSWEVSSNNPIHSEIPFHVFRNTGNHCVKQVDRLLSFLKNHKCYQLRSFQDLVQHEIH